jgi:formylglycine-generating enzyme required for sulfatase activity
LSVEQRSDKPDAAMPATVTAPEPLVWPFSAEDAKKGQEAWAKSLGQTVVEKNLLGMEMVLIPPGTFTMGSPDSEPGRFTGENEVLVTLAKPFWMARAEVTQRQWKSLMGTEPWNQKLDVKIGDDYPATYINWEDASEFCRRISKREGRNYRLPTEAEWEWSCRSGTKTVYSFVDKRRNLDEVAWFRGNTLMVNQEYAHPVSQKAPNAFGLSDMHGNALEWCEDKFMGSLTSGTDPLTKDGGTGQRSFRGGGWSSEPELCRSALRGGLDPGHRSSDMGFRPVVLSTWKSVVTNDREYDTAHSSDRVTQKSMTSAPTQSSKLSPAAGERLVVQVNGVDLPLRWCPAGSYTMGSPVSEPDRSEDENQVRVTLTKGFWMGETEVTQELYESVVGTNPSSNKGSRLPVELVSWEDAVAFCVKLTEQERSAGRLGGTAEYRLPTEAEWEYACRAGTTTATAFGETLSSEQANFDGNSPYNGAAKGPYLKSTREVGKYGANAWGLRDMHGNVWEWCADWYADRLKGGTNPSVDTATVVKGRVMRGSSWGYCGNDCRSSDRSWYLPGDRSSNVGFRCLRTE